MLPRGVIVITVNVTVVVSHRYKRYCQCQACVDHKLFSAGTVGQAVAPRRGVQPSVNVGAIPRSAEPNSAGGLTETRRNSFKSLGVMDGIRSHSQTARR